MTDHVLVRAAEDTVRLTLTLLVFVLATALFAGRVVDLGGGDGSQPLQTAPSTAMVCTGFILLDAETRGDDIIVGAGGGEGRGGGLGGDLDPGIYIIT